MQDSNSVVFDPKQADTLSVMGPTIQFVTLPEDDAPCILRGSIPPGVVVPLHSHPEPETFVQISGEIEALKHTEGDFEWVTLGPGSVLHIPQGARHAFRNSGTVSAVSITTTTPALGRFFLEIGVPVAATAPPAPPSREALQRLAAAAERHGHWLGSPEDNATVGITLPM